MERNRYHGITGRTAKAFLEGIGNLGFETQVFCYAVTNVNEELQKRVMMVVKRIILAMCIQYESGVVNDATRDAMRLRDSMQVFESE